MIKVTTKLFVLIMLLFSIAAFSDAGKFFDVTSSKNIITINKTVSYPPAYLAGIKTSIPGLGISYINRDLENDSDCLINEYDYCLFRVSNSKPAHITILGPTALTSIALCLNGEGALTCAQYDNVQINNYLFAVGTYQDFTGAGKTIPIVYRSTDFGLTWDGPTELGVPAGYIDNKPNAISCSEEGLTCTIVGYIGDKNLNPLVPYAWRTTDGGSTWVGAPVNAATNEILNSVSCSGNGSKCVAVSQKSYFGCFYSVDYQSSPLWSSSGCTTYTNLFSVSCSNSSSLNVLSNCSAVGLDNFNQVAGAYFTTNGGMSWFLSTFSQPINSVLLGVSCPNSSGHCVAVGYTIPEPDNQLIAYTSNDAGETWAPSPVPSPGKAFRPSNELRLRSVWCSSDRQCVATGTVNVTSTGFDYSLSYVTKDGGTTWVGPTIIGPPDTKFNGSFCPSANACFGVGHSEPPGVNNYIPAVFRTIDTGISWKQSKPLDSNSNQKWNLYGAGGTH